MKNNKMSSKSLSIGWRAVFKETWRRGIKEEGHKGGRTRINNLKGTATELFTGYWGSIVSHRSEILVKHGEYRWHLEILPSPTSYNEKKN